MEAESTGQATGSLDGNMALQKACREKFWDEMDDAQRLAKMREEVRYLRRTVMDMERAINSLKRHQHAHDGSLMIPLKSLENEDRPRGYFYDPLK